MIKKKMQVFDIVANSAHSNWLAQDDVISSDAANPMPRKTA
jgi:hypothetical protein